MSVTFYFTIRHSVFNPLTPTVAIWQPVGVKGLNYKASCVRPG